MTYSRSEMIIINRKRELRRRICIFGLATALFVALSIFFFCSKSIASDGSEEDLYKYYKYIQVSENETIYDIAECYGNTDMLSVEKYVSEVAFMNNLESIDSSISGMYLVVPYFDTRHPYT